MKRILTDRFQVRPGNVPDAVYYHRRAPRFRANGGLRWKGSLGVGYRAKIDAQEHEVGTS